MKTTLKNCLLNDTEMSYTPITIDYLNKRILLDDFTYGLEDHFEELDMGIKELERQIFVEKVFIAVYRGENIVLEVVV